jgi:hypothetical protein
MKNCTPLWREAEVNMVKHFMLGALLEVEMCKNCTRLWREEDFQVKVVKTQLDWKTFESSDGEKEHTVVARSTSPSQNVKTHQLQRS